MPNILVELVQAIGFGLAVILPLANPITTVALLLGLSQGMTPQQINRESLMASVYVFIILTVAFYAGQLVMKTFGISIPGLRIAGGLIVSFIGFRMLFPIKEMISNMQSMTNTDIQTNNKESIAFVPLAMPSTAGPGTIAMVITSASTMSQYTQISPIVLTIAPVCIFLLVAVILWLSLRSANTIMRLIGKGGVEATSRLMGFLLICMGVQFVINGVFELIKTFHTL